MTRGRGALVTGLAGVLVAVGAVAGCGRSVPFRPLEVGQCLPSSAEVVGRREQQPPVVGCGTEHRYEVYATPALPSGDAWPGQAAVDEAAKQLCYEQFEAGTGYHPLDLPDGVQELTIGPSESGWTGVGDRRVECLVVLPEDRAGSFIRPGGTGSPSA